MADKKKISVVIDPEEAKRFLRALGCNGNTRFRTFNDAKQGGVIPKCYSADDFEQLPEANEKGAGVFVVVNETTGDKDENVIGVRAVFVDLDGAPLEPVTDCGLTPHIVVETSPGRYHAYWKVVECPLDRFKPVQQAIAGRFNGDKSIINLSRVMRLPGFIHQKAEPFQTRIISIGDHEPYTMQQIIDGLQLDGFFQHEQHKSKQRELTTGNRPGDDYNRRVSWSDVLTPHGWTLEHTTSDRRELWIRPGKQYGISATANYAGSDMLYVFSDSAGLPVQTGLSKVAVYTHLQHGGDFAAAAKELARQGYGSKDTKGGFVDFNVLAGQGHDQHGRWPDPLDMIRLSQSRPYPPSFIIPQWLPVGYATLFAGHGGVGKSGLALLMAVCIALGLFFFGIPVQRKTVLYLSCEDREGVLHWRLLRICEYLGVSMVDLNGWLHVVDLVGHEVILYNSMPGKPLTPAYENLRHNMSRHGADVLFVDGIGDTYGGNENNRAEVKAYVNALLALIPPDDGAVVLVGHVAKVSAKTRDTAEGYSGSTAWHNSVRARWYLYPETISTDSKAEKTGSLLLELQKSNLGVTDLSMRFAWDNDAGLFVGKESASSMENNQADKEQAELDGILSALRNCPTPVPAARQGRHTAYQVLSICPEFPATLKDAKSGSKRFWRRIDQLARIQAVREEGFRRADRKITRILVSTDAVCANSTIQISAENDTCDNSQHSPVRELHNSHGGYKGGERCTLPPDSVPTPAEEIPVVDVELDPLQFIQAEGGAP